MADKLRYYKVVETDGMSADELQKTLNKATDGFPEMQIDHVIGTKIILGYDSMLNEKGRAEARLLNKLNAATRSAAGKLGV
ncbi:Uncharacterised protein [Niallia circulans]|uniref:hypothetical protein n=1 Tax=Niallia circulans TaxID=1397 RepID=UPI00077CA3F1|nr:hypothetical protein [Niallia circulans]MDR4315005.1 hypothetical protein [Niallia circulans]MED3839730.1 hypothetical protein [Niallia circulans]MED4241215.1 hypothetical protein [Niallia circulans]MED4247876.1 hypothetical protein [Niallia circulans]QKH61642.1 hypothetical protein FOC77_13780 [Niallia circulans]